MSEQERVTYHGTHGRLEGTISPSLSLTLAAL